MTSPTPNSIRAEIDAVIQPWIKTGLIIGQSAHSVRTLTDGVTEVCFPTKKNLSVVYKKAAYHELYNAIRSQRLFSAEFVDGGLVQMMYRFKNGKLVSHILAYYPNPALGAYSNDPTLFEEELLFADIVQRQLTAFPLRIDFDFLNASDVAHPHCHLTLGNLQNCRIPVSSALCPRWFMEFIGRNFYETPTHDFISLLPRHTHRLPATITRAEKQLIHLVIPAPSW